jgi:hypothetical protein
VTVERSWVRHLRYPDVMRAKATLTTLALLWLVACEAKLAPPAGPLSLRVSMASVLKPEDPRDVTVTFTNQSAQPLVVLPRLLRLQFEGSGAEYVPYPGPRLDPWVAH